MHLKLFLLTFVVIATAQNTAGYWWWTWQTGGNAPGGTNIGIAFNGWADPAKAIADSNAVKGRLPGTKFISIGGGNANGAWSSGQLNALNSAINSGNFEGYGGIAYDIEEGSAGLGSLFQTSFRAAKSRGLRVLVSVSHSAPYGFSDAATLMNTFFSDTNVDYLSPQLYTSGNEGENDYSTCCGVSWDQWTRARSAIIPSIVRASYYSSAHTYFSQHNINITGFVQWAN